MFEIEKVLNKVTVHENCYSACLLTRCCYSYRMGRFVNLNWNEIYINMFKPAFIFDEEISLIKN